MHLVTGMRTAYDTNAPKKATNLSVNADLLRRARELGLNLSQVFEEHLAGAVRRESERQWREENREAFEEYNRRVEARGSFGDQARRF